MHVYIVWASAFQSDFSVIYAVILIYPPSRVRLTDTAKKPTCILYTHAHMVYYMPRGACTARYTV